MGCRDELDIDPDTASYFLSRITIERGTRPGMSGVAQAAVHRALAHNAASPAAYF